MLKTVCKIWDGGCILTFAYSRCFFRRGGSGYGFVGQDMSIPMERGILIELKKVSCGKWLVKKEGAGFLPALAVAAAQCCGKGGVGIGSSRLGLWAEICMFPWRGHIVGIEK